MDCLSDKQDQLYNISLEIKRTAQLLYQILNKLIKKIKDQFLMNIDVNIQYKMLAFSISNM